MTLAKKVCKFFKTVTCVYCPMCLNMTSEDHVKCSEQDFDHQTLSCTNSVQTFEEITVLLVQSYIIICLQQQQQQHIFIFFSCCIISDCKKNKPRAKNLDLKVLEEIKSSYGPGWCTYDP
jgi:hypothetical protein